MGYRIAGGARVGEGINREEGLLEFVTDMYIFF